MRCITTATVAGLAFLNFAHAHVALWDKGMFGLNYPYLTDDPQNNNYDNDAPVKPLRELDGLTTDQWFAHGHKGFPPKSGDFMILPAGGSYNGEVACNRAQTRLRNPADKSAQFKYACSGNPGVGALHVMNAYDGPVDNSFFGGTALAIAYTSDVDSLKPNDMTIISVNYNSVWEREISYAIPAGLPACPPGGCLCTWNWIHQGNHGEGYPFEIYNNLYRCQVTGATGNQVVQKGAVPMECSDNPGACVKGPKVPMYLYQADGNNLPHLDDPPLYRASWGFADGAQNDIFSPASNPAPTGTGGYAPTATALPAGWTDLGCMEDDVNKRALDGGSITLNNNTISACTSYCASKGFNYAGVEFGKECWCGKSATLKTADPSTCNVACPGDIYSKCGGSSRMNVYRSPSAPTTTVAPSAFPTASLPSDWRSLGCNVDTSDNRALNRGSTTSSNNTIPSCIANCAAQGFAYAGVEYGSECWCGTSASLTAAAEGCDVPCSGDEGSFCGGSYRINVFTSKDSAVSVDTTTTQNSTSIVATAIAGTTAQNTTSVVATATTQASQTTVSTANQTVTSTSPTLASTSSAKTSTANFTTVVPSSTEANASSTATSITIALTTTPSTTNASTKASTTTSASTTSASAKTSSTTTSSKTTASTTTTSSTVVQPSPSSSASSIPADWEVLGCFVDTTPRILNSTFANDQQNTYARCISRCSAQGYKYAAVEYAEQCLCGNSPTTVPLHVAPATQCNSPCKGDKTAMCGGSWRVNLFRLKDGSPTPRSLPMPEGVKWTKRRKGMWKHSGGEQH
ncbi:hypothetical protein IAT40_004843 [Kwoniella sp. CBS 6097]